MKLAWDDHNMSELTLTGNWEFLCIYFDQTYILHKQEMIVVQKQTVLEYDIQKYTD